MWPFDQNGVTVLVVSSICDHFNQKGCGLFFVAVLAATRFVCGRSGRGLLECGRLDTIQKPRCLNVVKFQQ